MFLLLNHPSKLCLRKPVLVRSSPLLTKGVSSSFPQNQPFVIMYVDPCGADLGKIVIRRAGDITPLEKKVPLKEMETIASCNDGWLAILKDGFVDLQDVDLNPVATDTDPKHISLPPLVTLPHCQTQIVTNVAMSSSSPEEEDCVVAVKFLGPQISFCRPSQSNSEWTNVTIGNPCFFSAPVMFSKRDDLFRVPGSGGHLIVSWDLHTQTHTPKFRRLRFRKIPNLTMANKLFLDSCCKSERLVESRTTNEIFMVKLYKKSAHTSSLREFDEADHIEGKDINGTARMKTEALMVFKLDRERNAIYTQDIGDLCIFLTKSESFCVPASSFPDLFPNHVKIVDVDETTIVNLADQKWN